MSPLSIIPLFVNHMPIITLDNPLALQPLTDDPFLQKLRQLFVLGYGLPVPGQYKKLTDGLINQTYDIDNLWILQQVNPIFGAEVNEDIASLTPILQSNGIPVPTMCRACNGKYSIYGEDYGLDAGNWRLMTKLPGMTRHFVESIEQIRSVSTMIAHFHRAFENTKYTFKHTRPGVHDFDRHKNALSQAIETHKSHRLYQSVVDLNERFNYLSKFVNYTKVLGVETLRIIHGDPKISNFLFENNDIIGVVDLDTIALSRAAFDIGDGIRSWCNLAKEDQTPEYNQEYAREALGLYLEEVKVLTKEERESLPFAAPFITLELAMRFAKDALCEDYFGFDPGIGHGEHSLMRARSMAGLCKQMLGEA